jgi:4-hydroxythreonine-4-phosphate dehydrogenase
LAAGDGASSSSSCVLHLADPKFAPRAEASRRMFKSPWSGWRCRGGLPERAAGRRHWNRRHREAGRPDASSAAALAAIRRAVADVGAGVAAAVVTNRSPRTCSTGPVSPSGHTEYLAKLAEGLTGVAVMSDAVGARACGRACLFPAAQGRGRQAPALIVETGRIVARDLEHRFGIPRAPCRRRPQPAWARKARRGEDLDIVRPRSNA